MMLEHITMPEFKGSVKRRKTLVVPFGTIEAHGTHLPLHTDSLIISEVVKKASEKTPVIVAPCVPFGVCTSTGAHPGTLGITPGTLRRLVYDIVRDGAKKGFENFILISGHGGSLHVSALKEAGEGLVSEIEGINIAALSIYEVLGKDADGIRETKVDSHAGEIETSLVLYIAPTLVKGRAAEEYPRFQRPIISRDKVKRWPGAVWGDPGKATREKGERMFNLMVQGVVSLVKKIEKT
ncbi:MAG: creatininase family protein [Deltaproteobacteria bacterium]